MTIVPLTVQRLSWMKMTLFDAEASTTAYPLANVNGAILSKMVEYCKYHVAADERNGNKNEEEVKAWDNDFLKVDTSQLFEIILVCGSSIVSLQESSSNLSACMHTKSL